MLLVNIGYTTTLKRFSVSPKLLSRSGINPICNTERGFHRKCMADSASSSVVSPMRCLLGYTVHAHPKFKASVIQLRGSSFEV